jgi:hypothetical protein
MPHILTRRFRARIIAEPHRTYRDDYGAIGCLSHATNAWEQGGKENPLNVTMSCKTTYLQRGRFAPVQNFRCLVRDGSGLDVGIAERRLQFAMTEHLLHFEN